MQRAAVATSRIISNNPLANRIRLANERLAEAYEKLLRADKNRAANRKLNSNAYRAAWQYAAKLKEKEKRARAFQQRLVSLLKAMENKQTSFNRYIEEKKLQREQSRQKYLMEVKAIRGKLVGVSRQLGNSASVNNMMNTGRQRRT
jgi:hypothetical protein